MFIDFFRFFQARCGGVQVGIPGCLELSNATHSVRIFACARFSFLLPSFPYLRGIATRNPCRYLSNFQNLRNRRYYISGHQVSRSVSQSTGTIGSTRTTKPFSYICIYDICIFGSEDCRTKKNSVHRQNEKGIKDTKVPLQGVISPLMHESCPLADVISRSIFNFSLSMRASHRYPQRYQNLFTLASSPWPLISPLKQPAFTH